MANHARTARFDLVSLGETMLRMSVPSGRRLDDLRALEVEIGGAESNVCVALARLDRRVGWVSRLPDHALGAAVLRVLRADGVDVTAVRRVPGERIGTYYIEYAAPPRAAQVIYDRADSAAAHMALADVDWTYLLDTRILHLTGITAALSPSCYELVLAAVQRARAAGVSISFDVNFRSKLWSAAEAGARLRPILAAADILLCKSDDACALFDCSGGPAEIMAGLQALSSAQAIYCTFGAMVRACWPMTRSIISRQCRCRLSIGSAAATHLPPECSTACSTMIRCSGSGVASHWPRSA
ncbi:MAG: sugar kinase [Oscillochloris sp.]|nr:sugar kinase [Oscillochloris sp.]